MGVFHYRTPLPWPMRRPITIKHLYFHNLEYINIGNQSLAQSALNMRF